MNEMFNILYDLVSKNLKYHNPLTDEDIWSEDFKKFRQELYDILGTEKNKQLLDSCLLSLINICDGIKNDNCSQCLFIGMMIGMDFEKFVNDKYMA